MLKGLPMKRIPLLLMIAGCLCWISTKAAADVWNPIETNLRSNEKPRKILFIGNSYTYYNDLDVVLKKLAASGKLPVKLQTARLVKGGATLQDHYTDPKTLAMIAKVKWDLIVLQEQSMRPVENPPAFFEYAIKLDAKIKEQGARPVFYMTWARQKKPEMIEPLDQAYTQMGRQLDAFVAPVGRAWAALLKANPDMNLYVEDGSHPNAYGTYLAACVFYTTLTGLSPVGLSNAGLEEVTPQQALALQEAAWKAVQAYVREQTEATQKK